MKLGRLGVWDSSDKHKDAAAISAFAKTVERLGDHTLWYPEARGYELFTVAGYMLSQTSTLKIGSSIASIYARDAFTSRRGMISLNQLYGHRFILGLGVSHVPMVEGLRGHVYEKPVPAMRAYLNGIIKGEADAANFPICVAALGPLMLKLAGQMTRGAVPDNTTPKHTAEAAKILGPDKWLAIEQKVTIETDPVKGSNAWAARNCPATWYWITTGMPGSAWASPRPTCRTAGPTRSSTQWFCGGLPLR